MMKKKIKVCGMTDIANLEEICALKPDLIGYIFYPDSPRYVGDEPDIALFSTVPEGILKTGVFVNESYEKMASLCDRYDIEAVQLHGSEQPELCNRMKNIGLSVLKAISADQISDNDVIENYREYVDLFLFDTPTDSYGGSGKKFNWTVLDKMVPVRDFFLSGGISLTDVKALKEIQNPHLYGFDINSRFEISPGIKDADLVREFIKLMRDE